VKDDPVFHSSCIAGASTIDDLGKMLSEAGFTDIHIEPVDSSRVFIRTWMPGANAADCIVSASIRAMKP